MTEHEDVVRLGPEFGNRVLEQVEPRPATMRPRPERSEVAAPEPVPAVPRTLTPFDWSNARTSELLAHADALLAALEAGGGFTRFEVREKEEALHAAEERWLTVAKDLEAARESACEGAERDADALSRGVQLEDVSAGRQRVQVAQLERLLAAAERDVDAKRTALEKTRKRVSLDEERAAGRETADWYRDQVAAVRDLLVVMDRASRSSEAGGSGSPDLLKRLRETFGNDHPVCELVGAIQGRLREQLFEALARWLLVPGVHPRRWLR